MKKIEVLLIVICCCWLWSLEVKLIAVVKLIANKCVKVLFFFSENREIH